MEASNIPMESQGSSMKVDLHIHSKYSFDSILEPEKILKVAKKRGLDGIAITDHNTIKGGLEAKKINEDQNFFVIVGSEISTESGDIIGLFLNEEIKSRNSMEVIKEIKEQGGITVLPHPYKGHKNIEEIAKHVDMIEAYNARTSTELNEKAYNLARRLGKPTLAGSDAHLYREIGLAATQKDNHESEVLWCFKSNNYNIYLSQLIRSLKQKNVTIFTNNLTSLASFLVVNSGKLGLLISLQLIRKVYFDLFFRGFKKEVKDPDILFSSFLISWRNYMHSNGVSYEYDLMVGDVITRVKEKLDNVAGIDIDSNHLLRSYKGTKNKFIKSNDWICFEQYITSKNIFLSFYLTVKKVFGHQLARKYELYLQTSNSNLFQDIFNLLTAEYIIDKVKPKSIFLTCEYCGIQKQLTYVSNSKNVTTFALQHGIISPTHYGYIFNEGDKRKVILANITFIFGQYFYDLLTKKSIYTPNQVVVTGQPRYDVLYYANEIYNRDNFLKNYKIDSSNKIILWTTQCHGISNEENLKNFKAVFDTMQNIKNVTLIIKQHPGEGKRYTKMLEDCLNDYTLNAVVMPKNSDTYEQLFICDLLITKTSTTAMEAVALNKPVIILNLSGDSDPVDYVKEGVAFGVYNEEDLKPAIEKLVEDDFEQAKNRKEYIEKYLYKIDGKAAERVVSFLIQIIQNRKVKNEN